MLLKKPKPGISKYFIAIVPPPPFFELAMEWKNSFNVEFNAKAALKSPPHITLHMPFEWKTAKEEYLISTLTKFSGQQKPFEIQLNRFGCFPPRVIFIGVTENKALREMQSGLSRFCKSEMNLFNANRLDKPYHPHLTVAFRDLKKSNFTNAWESVIGQSFNETFLVDGFSLLKHDKVCWRVFKTLCFNIL